MAAETPDQALLRRTASAPDPGEMGLAAHIAGVFMAGMQAAMVRQQVRAAIQAAKLWLLRMAPAVWGLHTSECLNMVQAPSVTSPINIGGSRQLTLLSGDERSRGAQGALHAAPVVSGV